MLLLSSRVRGSLWWGGRVSHGRRIEVLKLDGEYQSEEVLNGLGVRYLPKLRYLGLGSQNLIQPTIEKWGGSCPQGQELDRRL